MAAKKKKKSIELEDIPSTLQKITSLIDREIDTLGEKSSLSFEDSKNLIAYATALSNIYKDYRAEILSIQKDFKSKSKEEILAIINADGRTN